VQSPIAEPYEYNKQDKTGTTGILNTSAGNISLRNSHRGIFEIIALGIFRIAIAVPVFA